MLKVFAIYLLGVVVGIIIDNMFWYGVAQLRKNEDST